MECEYRPGLWMIQFTAADEQQARECTRPTVDGKAALTVTAAGRYGSPRWGRTVR